MEEAGARKGVASRYERGSEEFSRTLALSDGVFAIAMTLLVVTIALPTLDNASSTDDMLDALGDLSGSFISFFISFAVIARYWAAHQQQFSMLARMDRGFVGLNLV
ncbi:MAG TPA: TMEM175 family protein, partial [Solirubrobacterales bacterium]|nr:TMEM175 family protein [Solirubrobacterales bacterium]